jgi:hypothetical protein
MAHNPLANAISFTAPISQGGITTNYTVDPPGALKDVTLSADRNLEVRPGNSNSPHPPNGSDSKILNNPNSI